MYLDVSEFRCFAAEVGETRSSLEQRLLHVLVVADPEHPYFTYLEGRSAGSAGPIDMP